MQHEVTRFAWEVATGLAAVAATILGVGYRIGSRIAQMASAQEHTNEAIEHTNESLVKIDETNKEDHKEIKTDLRGIREIDSDHEKRISVIESKVDDKC